LLKQPIEANESEGFARSLPFSLSQDTAKAKKKTDGAGITQGAHKVS